MDSRSQHKNVPFTGKLMTGEPASIGHNFRTLENLRYTDTHVKGVQGMTKVNSTGYATLQDYTDYTEVDVPTRVTVAANTLTIANLDQDEEVYLYYDFGADYFDGDFEFQFDSMVNAGTNEHAYIWGLANDVDDLYATAITNNKDCLFVRRAATGATATLSEYNSGSGISRQSITLLSAVTYYFTIRRDESIGTYGTLYLYIYSDSGRSTLVSTCTVTLTEKKDFRYLYAMSAYKNGSTGKSLNGTISNLRLIDTQTPKSVFHFSKSQPAESHVLVQSDDDTDVKIYENTTVIPDAGTFEDDVIWTDSSGAGLGRFSDAPDGQMIYCNEVDSCIWGGNEIKVGAFITSTAVIADAGSATDPKDFTKEINNTKQDGDNVVYIGGGIDTYTKLLIHANEADGTAGTDIIDSETTPKTITAAGDAQVDTSQAKFGTGSVKFDGTGDYLTLADSDDWYMGTGKFTIDFQVYYKSSYGTEGYFQQRVDADNEVCCYTQNGYVYFQIRSGGTTVVTVQGTITRLKFNDWNHIAIIRGWGGNTNDWVVTINGNKNSVSAVTDADAWPDLAAAFEIGRCYSGVNILYLNRWIDEFRVSKGIARWTENFTPPERAYTDSSNYWLVGSQRPLKGLKYYISNGNTIVSVMTGKEWNGNSWSDLTLTDNTDTGASLAVTGTVTFNSTVDSAKPKYLDGYFLYWYQFYVDAGDATIYHTTLDAPFQDIIDMWDGVYRSVTRFYKYTTAYLDNTINVLENDYYVSTASSYCDLSSMGAYSDPNNCLEIGFTEKMTGIQIQVAPDYTNSTADTTATIDYWTGTEYVTVGTITDGTSESDISLAKSGVISWNNSALSNETLKVIANSPPLYYYRVRFDKAMDASVRVSYVSGITAQKEIGYYKFPVFAQGRVLLCGDMANEKNKATCSAKFMPQTYNGNDSVDLYFGESGELTCGMELFSLYGSSLYSIILMFKDYETWMVSGQDIDVWTNNTFLVSSSIGCPAPLTLKTINLSSEPGTGVNRTLAIWQGTDGVYMSDGRAPIPIHIDIKEYFDRSDSRCIRASKIGDSIGFVDHSKQEYHLLIASGSSATTLNVELVYDIHRNKWFQIDRTLDLQNGTEVHDTDGNAYNYGFLDTGYMERLEYGTDFDGNDIVHTVQFGDFPLSELAFQTRLSHAKLITVAKTTTSNEVTCTHYADTGIVETAVAAVGTITMSGIATENETFVIDTQTFTWKAARAATGQVTIGANAAAAVANIVTAVTEDLSTVTASDGTGDTVVVTAVKTGVLGNSIIFTEDSTNMAVDGSDVLGGTTAGAYATATTKTMSPSRTGHRLAIPYFDEKYDGDPFHSFKFTMTTNDETVGIEPLALVLTYHDTKED